MQIFPGHDLLEQNSISFKIKLVSFLVVFYFHRIFHIKLFCFQGELIFLPTRPKQAIHNCSFSQLFTRLFILFIYFFVSSRADSIISFEIMTESFLHKTCQRTNIKDSTTTTFFSTT